jgi:hypothetical protein
MLPLLAIPHPSLPDVRDPTRTLRRRKWLGGRILLVDIDAEL